MVRDPRTKEPAAAEAKRMVAEAWSRGVILATASALPNVLKIKPPLIISEVEVGTVLQLKNPLHPGCQKKVQCQAASVRPSEAYSRYAATSARAGGVPVRRMGPRRWAFSAAC